MGKWPRMLVFGMLFALSHTQSPLYYSNQNQYFLHGLAQGGYGDLANDWLANTADPTPLFSGFVALAWKMGCGPFLYQAVFFLALVAYFVILADIVTILFGERILGFWAVGFTLVHSALPRIVSMRLLGEDYPWFFQSGLAGQYLLGPGLQPSVVGIGLLWSLGLFLRGHSLAAAGVAAGVNIVHSTYLLPSAMLVGGYMLQDGIEKGWRRVATIAVIGSIVVAPVLVFNYMHFAPKSPQAFREAQAIIAWDRIPHHAKPARWFDWLAALQILWMFLGLALTHGGRLFPALCFVYAFATAVSLVALFSGDAMLSLLFPWRISAVLVPLSTAFVFGRLSKPFQNSDRLLIPAIVFLLVIAASSVLVYRNGLGFRSNAAEDPVMEYVRDHRQPGELYMVPARFTKPTNARGVFSATFSPPPDPNAAISFEIQRFRLFTGAPIYVDFKSIPYREDEVLEWHRRVERVQGLYAKGNWSEEAIARLKADGITRVVWPAAKPSPSPELEEIFDSRAYKLFRLRKP